MSKSSFQFALVFIKPALFLICVTVDGHDGKWFKNAHAVYFVPYFQILGRVENDSHVVKKLHRFS